MRTNVKARSIDQRNEWITVVWEVDLNNKRTIVESSYGPSLRPIFEESLRNSGYSQAKNIIDKEFNARVYQNRSGEWKVAPENLINMSSSTVSVVSLSVETNSNAVVEASEAPLKESNLQVTTKPATLTRMEKMGDSKILNLINDDCWAIKKALESSQDPLNDVKKLREHCLSAKKRDSIKQFYPELFKLIENFYNSLKTNTIVLDSKIKSFHQKFVMSRSEYGC